MDVSTQQAAATSYECTQMPQQRSVTAATQPACPATSSAEAMLELGKDSRASAGSLETSGSDSGVSGAFSMRAALPQYAGHLEGTRVGVYSLATAYMGTAFVWQLMKHVALQEAPPDFGRKRLPGQAYASLPRIVSAPCLLSVSMGGSSQRRLLASSLKRGRDAVESSGSGAERHSRKRHVAGGGLLPSASNDSGDSAETVQLEDSSAAPLTAAGAEGITSALGISRCREDNLLSL